MTSTAWDERSEAPVVTAPSFADVPLPGVDERQRASLTCEEDPRLTLETLLLRRDHPDLVVVLHGALVRKDVTLPRFEWLRSLRERPENLLFVSDPSLAWDERVPLAWYVGPEQHDAMARVATEVSTLAQRLGTTRTAFTGSSGGGFASLALAASTPGSLAVSFSPQTRISRYGVTMAVKTFRTRLFPDHPDMDAVEAAHQGRVDMVHRWNEDPGSFVRYVQNSRDPDHIEAHMRPFLAATGVDPETFEGNRRVSVALDDFGEGHSPPRPQQMRAHLDAALAWHEGVRSA